MLARVYGLAGVALGTVLPMGIASVAVLFPAACRRANVRVRDAFATAVWPSVWPAMCMACVLLLVRNVISEGAAGMAMMTLLGGVIYLGLFFGVAISRQEREWYLSKAKQALHDVRFRLPLRSSP